MTAVLAQATQSLADPKNPTFCCRYYICLLSQIDLSDLAGAWENPVIPDVPYAELELNLEDLAQSGSLLTAISMLATTYRAREDMTALAQRMEHCECNRADPLVDQLHAWQWNSAAWCRDPAGWVCRTTTMDGLIAIIADLLFYSLQMRGMQPIPWPWPGTPRECLAGDDETAATMLCRWLDLYPILPILRAITAVASLFGRRVIVPFLLSAHLPKNLRACSPLRALDPLGSFVSRDSA